MVKLNYFIKKKIKTGKVNEKEIRDAIMKRIRTDKIVYICKDHGEISVVNYSGDNKAFGITHDLIAQDKTSKGRTRSDNGSVNDPSKRLHVSMMEVRTITGMAKTAPDGSTRLNLHLLVDEEGGVLRHPDLEERLDAAQELITRD